MDIIYRIVDKLTFLEKINEEKLTKLENILFIIAMIVTITYIIIK